MSLLKLLFGRRRPEPDGSSPATAIPVASIPEEYLWVAERYPDFTIQGQQLANLGGKRFDILVLESPDGRTHWVYFEIRFELGHGLPDV
ncbi:MAG: hypothetical protein V9G18_13585 [Albidovulum sp.]